MAGEFGSIVWSRKDPKTWELTNTEPSVDQQVFAQAMAPAGAAPGSVPGDLTDYASVYNERGGVGFLDEGTSKDRREWRKMIRAGLRGLKKYGDYEYDTNDFIQELIDSGAIRYGDNGQPGLASNMAMRLSDEDNAAMVAAADRWASDTGQFRDGKYDPSGYRPYNSEQQRAMHEGRFYWGSEEQKQAQREQLYQQYLDRWSQGR